MAYTRTFDLALGSSQTGLTLSAQLVDTAGTNVGSAVATGFVELGVGNYTWTYASIPDGHRGAVVFTASAVVKAIASINPSPMVLRRNTAFSAFAFAMYDTTGAPATGLTVTATRSIDGAAFAACTNSASEVSAGVYVLDLAAADLNGGCITLKFAAPGTTPTLITVCTVLS